jgi:hypothetical protein
MPLDYFSAAHFEKPHLIIVQVNGSAARLLNRVMSGSSVNVATQEMAEW